MWRIGRFTHNGRNYLNPQEFPNIKGLNVTAVSGIINDTNTRFEMIEMLANLSLDGIPIECEFKKGLKSVYSQFAILSVQPAPDNNG